jgi:hypothetical protein
MSKTAFWMKKSCFGKQLYAKAFWINRHNTPAFCTLSCDNQNPELVTLAEKPLSHWKIERFQKFFRSGKVKLIIILTDQQSQNRFLTGKGPIVLAS